MAVSRLVKAACAGLIAATGIGCAPTADRFDELLQSNDRAAVYNAGVEAYHAKRFAVARELWKRAADLGSHEAASNVGFLMYYGLGGAPDSAAGAAYWRQAMIQQDAEAHRHVAQAILDGDRRLGTLAEAYSHAVAARALSRNPEEVAGDGVGRDARQLLDSIGVQLPVAERGAAERLGQSWARSYPAP